MKYQIEDESKSIRISEAFKESMNFAVGQMFERSIGLIRIKGRPMRIVGQTIERSSGLIRLDMEPIQDNEPEKMTIGEAIARIKQELETGDENGQPGAG